MLGLASRKAKEFLLLMPATLYRRRFSFVLVTVCAAYLIWGSIEIG